jgi:hypothetical protein
MSKPQGKCIFCDGYGLTKEHIWAKWLNPYLPKNVVNHKFFSEIYTLDDQCIKLKSGQARRRAGASVAGQRAQSMLSAWIAMFVMVAEFLDKTGIGVAISPKDRLFVKANLAAPPSMKIWIGYYERDKWKGVWIHITIPISDENHIPQRSKFGVDFPNMQATTFVIGKLFIHVLSSELTGVVRANEIRRGAKSQLYRIHSLKNSPLGWPPPVRITDRDADTIASAFSERARRNLILES